MRYLDWSHSLNLEKEINEIYIHRFLFTLAITSISLFIPLYLYELDYSLLQISLFYLVYLGVAAVTAVPFGYLTAKLGYKKTAILSSPLLITFYIALRELTEITPTVYGIALLGGIGMNMYWMAMNAEMTSTSDDEKRGTETGIFFSMPELAAVISPFLGGAIIALQGFNMLYTYAAFTVLASYFPFIYSKERHSGMETSIAQIYNRKHLTDFATFFFQGTIHLGRMMIWPLYLAIIITGAMDIGAIGSLMALGSAIMSITSGKLVDKIETNKIVMIGGLIFSITWLVMSQVTTTQQALIIAFLNGLLSFTINLPVFTKVMENAEKEDILQYLALREIGLATGRVTLILLLIILALQTTSNQLFFVTAFTFIAINTLLTAKISQKL